MNLEEAISLARKGRWVFDTLKGKEHRFTIKNNLIQHSDDKLYDLFSLSSTYEEYIPEELYHLKIIQEVLSHTPIPTRYMGFTGTFMWLQNKIKELSGEDSDE